MEGECCSFLSHWRSKLYWDIKNQVRNLVYNAHGHVFGGDVISKVECQYSGSVKTGFLCYSSTFVDEKGMQRMMCFSDPQLLALLKYPMVSEILSLHQNC